RRVSKMLNIVPVGTCSIIVKCYRQKIITREEAVQILDELLKVGFRISIEVYRKVLLELGLR
ncbi:MAG: DUF3368 domain-containing protein, partial [Nitrososphaeria archaeon]